MQAADVPLLLLPLRDQSPPWLQVADEHGLEVSGVLPQASAAPLPAQQQKVTAAADSDLTARLAELRGK